MVIQKTPRPPLIAPTKKNKNEHRTAAVDVAATQEGPALAGEDNIVEVCRCVGKGRMHGGGGQGGRGVKGDSISSIFTCADVLQQQSSTLAIEVYYVVLLQWAII